MYVPEGLCLSGLPLPLGGGQELLGIELVPVVCSSLVFTKSQPTQNHKAQSFTS